MALQNLNRKLFIPGGTSTKMFRSHRQNGKWIKGEQIPGHTAGGEYSAQNGSVGRMHVFGDLEKEKIDFM
jgi:hypothetical protein